MKLFLLRSMATDEGTFGKLYLPDGRSVFSGELPWKTNLPNVSCIPNGVYLCSWAFSPHFKREVYHVQDVPGREAILIHPANFMGDKTKGLRSDLEGCIALGMALGSLDGQRALINSTQAIGIFETLLAKQPFDLVISFL